MSEIVRTNWLYKNLKNKNLVIFDCSWYMPNEKRNTFKEYKGKHIKNSFFFDIEKICNINSLFPHMLPSIQYFTRKMKYFNIHKNSTVVTYSSNGFLGSARVWWMFKYFGFDNIYVLNGGLKKWVLEKRKTSTVVSKKKLSTFNFIIAPSS